MTAATETLVHPRFPAEHAVSAYRAFVLQARVTAVPPPAKAQLRTAVARSAPLAALPDGVQRALLTAAGAAADETTRNRILSLGASEPFHRLPRAVQRSAMMNLVGALPASVRATVAVATGPVLPQLVPDVQAALLQLTARHGDDAIVARAVAALVTAPGTAKLSGVQQMDLTRWLAGPKLAPEASPMRAQRVSLAWNLERAALTRVLRAPAFLAADADAQAELILDFLHQPSRPLHVLDATQVSGHAVVVFGDPCDPRALSYGRRWICANGRAEARVASPDPSVLSVWQRPAVDAITTYACTRTLISRIEEWQLLGFIETTFTVADDLRVNRRTGVRRIGGAARGFLASVRAAIGTIAAESNRSAASHFYVRAGKAVELGPRAEEEDALAAYLRA